jgi:hypothetical protein
VFGVGSRIYDIIAEAVVSAPDVEMTTSAAALAMTLRTSSASSVDIDYGDGSALETVATGNNVDTAISHTFANGGNHTVKFYFVDNLLITRFIAINQSVQGMPLGLNKLTNLQRLHLTGAAINAPLLAYTWLWSLTNLQQLWLDNCGLTDALPAGISALNQLQLLYLNNNSLTSQIPWASFSTTMTQLYLNANQFVGKIAAQCANMTVLQKLRLDLNDLTAYEDDAFNISTLTEIRLQDNLRLPEVVVDGIFNDFNAYTGKATTGTRTINVNNCAAPSADSQTARTALAAAGWGLTVDAVAGYQRIMTFEASDLGIVASGNGTENATMLPEGRYRHGDSLFPSIEASGTAIASVVSAENGVTPYQGSKMLKLAITGATSAGQQGARWLTRWRHNEGAGSPLPDTHYYSCWMYLPAEVVLDAAVSDRFNSLFQDKWNSTANGSQAMLSLNTGHPSGSGNPAIYQFYWNHKQLGFSQVQYYQSSPVAIPIAQWFALEMKLTYSTTSGSNVNEDGTIQLWQGTPGSMSQIFNLTGKRTRYDAETDGRLNWGPCAYGKGIVGGALTIYIDNIIISPTRVYS